MGRRRRGKKRFGSKQALVTKSSGIAWPSKTNTWNAWQFANTRSEREFGQFAPVFACWRIISEEIARVPLRVVERQEDGAKRVITNNAAARIFQTPNDYQTISDFLLYGGQSLLSDGNFYAFATRNNRFEVNGLYPVTPSKTSVFLEPTTGESYYRVGDSETLSLSNVEKDYWFPARDMLHIRLFTTNHPLVGVSPLTAAVMGVNAGMNINAQAAAFFGNMNRPSGIVSHPKKLEPPLVERIKQRFIEATNGENAGAPVVLQDGMTWTPMSMSAVDAEVIQSYKLTERQVAQIYRVPPFFLGDMDVTKLSSVEALMRYFLNTCLGFYFTHIANALTRFFRLPVGQSIEFDYETALLQGDLEARIQAYAKGVQGGIYTPNEARSRFDGLSPVEYGDDVRMQQQMVPLSFGAQLQPDSSSAASNLIEENVEAERRIRVLNLRHQIRNRLSA